jgi:hypothetical protein
MKIPNCFYGILLLVMLVSSSGCGAVALMNPTPTITPVLPTPTSTATATPVYQTLDGVPLGANLNCPDRAAFGYLEENVPVNGAIMDSPILFRWYYWPAGGTPTDWSTVCVPTSFGLNLAAGPDYNSVSSITIINPTIKDMTHYLLYSFYLSDPLPPHTFYRWMVTGSANGIDMDQEQLPLLHEDSAWKKVNNNSDMMGEFQTGPICTSLNITPANLISPPNGAVLDNDTPVFKWGMPDCAGQAFSLTFDTDPQMTSPDFGWATKVGNFQIFAGRLQPCTPYYWQVQTGLYSIEYHLSQGGWAYPSEIRSFSIRSMACPDGWVEPTITPTPTFIPWTPTPTATATLVPQFSCSNYPDRDSCEANSKCDWYIFPVTSFPKPSICVPTP